VNPYYAECMSTENSIYIDYDDVLCETARPMTALVHRMFGRQVAFEDIRYFDLSRSFGLTPQEHEAFMSVVHQDEFLDGLPAFVNAERVVRGWLGKGYQIHIVTGRPPSSHGTSVKWLKRNSIPYHRLSFVDKYSRKHPPQAGVDALTLDELGRMSFRLAVEDSAHMAAFLSTQGIAPVALLDRPWNRGDSDGNPLVAPGICRCADWLDLYARFPAP